MWVPSASPTDLGFTDVTAATVGPPASVYTIDWTKQKQNPTPTQVANNICDAIFLYNESGAGFTVQLASSRSSFPLPAGAWAGPIPVSGEGLYDLKLTLTTMYVLPNAGVSQVHAMYLPPSQITANWAAHTLGNSPASLSGSVLLTAITLSTMTFPSPHNWTIQEDVGGDLQVTDTTTGKTSTFSSDGDFFPADNLQLSAGGIASLDGQPTAGAFGVPGVMAKTTTAITSTSLFTCLNFTPPVAAVYRLSGQIALANTGTAVPTCLVTYRGRSSGSTSFNPQFTRNAATIPFNGTGETSADYAMVTVSFYAQTSLNITVTFQDTGGIPNETVDLFLELLI